MRPSLRRRRRGVDDGSGAEQGRPPVVIDGRVIASTGPWTATRGDALRLANQLLRANQVPEHDRRVATALLAVRDR